MNGIFRQHWLGLLLIACLLGVQSPPTAAQGMTTARDYLASLPRERIAVETRSARRHLFEAWRAESYRTRARGLMYVQDSEMRPDEAMIFIYEPAQRVTMWMKNTLLPLDMLFVDPRGCIVSLHERATPGSVATIDSHFPVTLVVELKGGLVAERGIRIGDRVVRLDADWPGALVSCESHAR